MVDYYSLSFVNTLERFGVLDVLLPFILIFTISFAVLQKISLFGSDHHERKKFSAMISLVIALLVIVPHVRGSYPFGYDPIDAINAALPSVSLVAVAVVMLLLILGIFGTQFAASALPIIGIVSVLFVLYIFGAAANLWQSPTDIFTWWDPDITNLIIVILVFGLIVWFIVREPPHGTHAEGMGKWFKELFKPL